MNRLSVSLPWDYLSGTISSEEAHIIKSRIGSNQRFLLSLKDSGITAIELRHRSERMTDDEMKRAVATVREFGFGLSIHGESLVEPRMYSQKLLFPWYDIVGDIFTGGRIVVTLHPFVGDMDEKAMAELTVENLKMILAANEHSNLVFALENQRRKEYRDPGNTFEGVARMVDSVSDDRVGICWDMGHSFSNTLNHDHPVYPSEEFLSQVLQTHIHDLGPDGRTHWPFKENKVPLEENLRLLQAGEYQGAFNLELSFDRFGEEEKIEALVLESIGRLVRLTSQEHQFQS